MKWKLDLCRQDTDPIYEMEVGFVPPGYRSDIPSRDRRGAISAEVYHDEEIKNFSRKVKIQRFCHEKKFTEILGRPKRL